MHYRMLSNIPGFYLLDDSSICTIVTIKNVSIYCQIVLRGKEKKNHSKLITVALTISKGSLILKQKIDFPTT
jgi:hypothetical protein